MLDCDREVAGDGFVVVSVIWIVSGSALSTLMLGCWARPSRVMVVQVRVPPPSLLYIDLEEPTWYLSLLPTQLRADSTNTTVRRTHPHVYDITSKR